MALLTGLMRVLRGVPQLGAGDLDLLTPAPLGACHNAGGHLFLFGVSGLAFAKIRDYTKTKGPLSPWFVSFPSMYSHASLYP